MDSALVLKNLARSTSLYRKSSRVKRAVQRVRWRTVGRIGVSVMTGVYLATKRQGNKAHYAYPNTVSKRSRVWCGVFFCLRRALAELN